MMRLVKADKGIELYADHGGWAIYQDGERVDFARSLSTAKKRYSARVTQRIMANEGEENK